MGKINEEYRYVTTSKEMFVKQVVTNFICKGYPMFVQGKIPEDKCPIENDKKMLDLYDIRKTSKQRWLRKQQGKGNLHYIRFERDFLLLGTERKNGVLPWHRLESKNIRDCRVVPILFHGYSIYLKGGKYRPRRCKEDPEGPPERDTKERSRVLIERKMLKELSADFYKVSRRDAALIASMFWELPFEPYRPVLQQQLKLLCSVNNRRKKLGLSKISSKCIRKMYKADKVYVD